MQDTSWRHVSGLILQQSRRQWIAFCAVSATAGCCEESMGEHGIHGMNSVTYEDVYISFTQDEWALLNHSQKSLYKDVMLETYRNLTAIGYSWEDHNFEEHSQNARKDGRYERNHNGEKPSEYTQCAKAFACYSHLQRLEKFYSAEKPYDGIQYDETIGDRYMITLKAVTRSVRHGSYIGKLRTHILSLRHCQV
ncbi:hypothetical protein U0070_008899 [Myodes glareolus]|uniref:KRAB domain-containing protein n=1 Tax=Myodes glareolus TaxID=447135 RepID=A0AAW0HVU1_MYOGA